MKVNNLEAQVEQQIKADLWKKYGSAEFPAEWDGTVFGGGKLSQRWWEYFKAIEYLNLEPESVVLDIGGGSTRTGAGFFAGLIRPYVRKVIIADPCISPDATEEDDLKFVRKYLGPGELKEILENNINISHIISISVMEHIDDELRVALMNVINTYFNGSVFVSTFEFHSKTCFFESQLTTKSLSEMFKPLTNFYPSRIESAPYLCENAFEANNQVPRWFPVAVKFEMCGYF